MSQRRAFVILALFVWFSGAGCAVRTTVASLPGVGDDWSSVTRLPRNVVVKVDVGLGSALKGRLVDAQPDQITMTIGLSPRTVLRTDVRSLTRVDSDAGEKARKGLLYGAIFGGTWGALVTRGDRAWTTMMAGGWGAFSSLIGAIDGALERTETLVYVAAVP